MDIDIDSDYCYCIIAKKEVVDNMVKSGFEIVVKHDCEKKDIQKRGNNKFFDFKIYVTYRSIDLVISRDDTGYAIAVDFCPFCGKSAGQILQEFRQKND